MPVVQLNRPLSPQQRLKLNNTKRHNQYHPMKKFKVFFNPSPKDYPEVREPSTLFVFDKEIPSTLRIPKYVEVANLNTSDSNLQCKIAYMLHDATNPMEHQARFA